MGVTCTCYRNPDQFCTCHLSYLDHATCECICPADWPSRGAMQSSHETILAVILDVPS